MSTIEITTLGRIHEMRSKVLPLIKEMHDVYVKFKSFQSTFSDVYLSVRSNVRVQQPWASNTILINFDEFNSIVIGLGKTWSFSLIHYKDNVYPNAFNFEFRDSFQDSYIINKTDNIKIKIAKDVDAWYCNILKNFLYNDMEFDDYESMVMQLQTIMPNEFFGPELVNETLKLIQDMCDVLPDGYTFTYDNLYTFLKDDDILDIIDELRRINASLQVTV